MTALLRDIAATYELLADSYLATLAIALVIAYLGVFVVLKRIVFLGITLAQAASAGVALSFFVHGRLGHETAFAEAVEHHGPTVSALGVSTLGVLGFALPAESKRLSREALLGLGYALFGGASIILVWVSPKGVDELKNLLAGDVLFARSQLPTLLLGLSVVALLHACLRKEFLLASFDAEFARTLKLPVKLYEVLLALSLGVAVSLALKVAGVLLVFAFLTVPPLAGLAIGRKLGEATLVALAVAAAGSWIGFYVSFRADLPTAPTIACVLVGLAGVAAVASKLGDKGRIAFHVFLAPLAAAALLSAVSAAFAHEGIYRWSAPSHEHDVGMVGSATSHDDLVHVFETAADPEARFAAAKKIAESGDDALVERFLRGRALGDDEESIREMALSAIEKFGDRARAIRAIERLLRADDVPHRLHAALGLLRLGDQRGVGTLIDLLDDDHVKENEVRLEASEALLKLEPAAKDWYDAFGSEAERHKGAVKWREWWRARATKVPR